MCGVHRAVHARHSSCADRGLLAYLDPRATSESRWGQSCSFRADGTAESKGLASLSAAIKVAPRTNE
ncbi:hypothetical protein NDU88_006710 [Pleurodeles waltl]|uniref:Uncharacterized protein n=1 Tax=Pleurodeles waltl TaxID=8319 RepID=A0AAV7PJ54_PLEWA|nr:hypothetical protein NDU88_006710 [Pleurodeles waltl]